MACPELRTFIWFCSSIFITAYVPAALLRSSGRQKLIFGIYVVLTVLAVILAPKLTIALGIFGAALAYLILMIVMAAGFVGGAWIEIQKEIREVRHDG